MTIAQIVSVEKVRSTRFEKAPVNYPQLSAIVARECIETRFSEGLSTVLRRKLKDVSGLTQKYRKHRFYPEEIDSKLRKMKVREN